MLSQKMYLYRIDEPIPQEPHPKYSIVTLKNVVLKEISDGESDFTLFYTIGRSIQIPNRHPVFQVGDCVSLIKKDTLPPVSAVITGVCQKGDSITAELVKGLR